MSYWTVPIVRGELYRNTGSNVFPYEVEMFKTAAELLSKAYGNVHLITDDEGKEKLKSIEWSSIDTSLNNLPKEYFNTWSLGKLKTYNIISQRGESFLHVDGDFFINQRLPKSIEEKPIIFEAEENASRQHNYVTAAFRDYCTFKHLTIPGKKCIELRDIENRFEGGILPARAFNCGIVGGSDMDYFFNYSESSLRTIFDPLNKPFFTADIKERKRYHLNISNHTNAILAEQYYAAIIAKAMDRTPYFIDANNSTPGDNIHRWLKQDSPNTFKYLHLRGFYKIYFEQIFHHKIFTPSSLFNTIP